MNHFETSELPAKSDFSNNDSSHALFADSIGSNPSKIASKQETLASNDGYATGPHGSGIPDVTLVEPNRPGIPDVKPVVPPIEPQRPGIPDVTPVVPPIEPHRPGIPDVTPVVPPIEPHRPGIPDVTPVVPPIEPHRPGIPDVTPVVPPIEPHRPGIPDVTPVVPPIEPHRPGIPDVTPVVPPIEPHRPGIPNVTPVVPPIEPHNYQQQAQQQPNNRVDGTNKQQSNVNASSTNAIDASNSVRTGATSVNTGATNVNTGATNVRTGDTIYKNNSYANARAEALPGNDCQLFAVRGDGYLLGTGGGAGLSVSSEECIKAKAEKVTCDASVSLGVANQYNSAAEQSWLQHVNPAQQQQIIEHGMRNTQRISDNAVNKSAECTQVNKRNSEQEQQEQPREAFVPTVDTSNLATKDELKQVEERSTHRVNQAFEHGLQK